MEIAVRYAGTSKTGVCSYAIFANGLRVGFIKNNALQPSPWRAVTWSYTHLGDFETDFLAAKAVLEFYKGCRPRQLKGFKRHAAKLENFLRKKNRINPAVIEGKSTRRSWPTGTQR